MYVRLTEMEQTGIEKEWRNAKWIQSVVEQWAYTQIQSVKLI